MKDIEKAVADPNAAKDEQGRLRVAAATTVGDKGYGRTERLLEAGVDLVVVDTAHGHSQHVLDAVNRIKRASNKVQVVAGNLATTEGAEALSISAPTPSRLASGRGRIRRADQLDQSGHEVLHVGVAIGRTDSRVRLRGRLVGALPAHQS